ncbi:hypothetical protein KY331_03345 [Candidatus Woesearchaeota archaeon]|nr:hypothetical protein [Candidatus Woesearchaeota archaeon]
MLSGKKLLKNVDFAIAKYPEVFDALEEYDRTHRLKKINYKERANFTIDSNLLMKFRKYCKEHGMKMSSKIEQYMIKELEKQAK